jgi:hypothetical protein
MNQFKVVADRFLQTVQDLKCEGDADYLIEKGLGQIQDFKFEEEVEIKSKQTRVTFTTSSPTIIAAIPNFSIFSAQAIKCLENSSVYF